MHRFFMISISLVSGLMFAALFMTGARAAEDPLKQAAVVSAEITAFANQLSLRPKTANDFSKVSGEYCFYSGADKATGWDKHHTHYAIDPTKTQEDVIDYIDARPLLEAGANFDNLPMLPAELGKMIPGQWYMRLANANDPHHGKGYDYPELMRASDLQ